MIALPTRCIRSSYEELCAYVLHAKSPRLRTMRQFAEDEFVLPTGDYKGRRFRCARQPLSGLWFDAVDSGLWQRFVVTGPSQASKTTVAYSIPLLYHLFEHNETVIAGVPVMELAGDKWRRDILPAIEASRYRDLLPRHGNSNRESVEFRNGAVLRFMSGGGDDKPRAGFTARIVVITETEALDKSGGRSVESDKVTQMIARTRSFDDRARIYMECTVSTEKGRTWREYQEGTASEIVLPCPHCGAHVTPERENVLGWEDADSVVEARENTRFHCPKCGAPWSEEERAVANHRGLLVHRGQSVRRVKGIPRVVGKAPRTDTLGFRWGAVHNNFLSAGHIGVDLWRASRDPDPDNAARYLSQFVFAKPYKGAQLQVTPVEPEGIMARVLPIPRGQVPAWCDYLTVGVDLRKWFGHYIVIAWRRDGTGHIVDYGLFELRTDQLGVEAAMLAALREFRDGMCLVGWLGADGEVRIPDQVWIDSGYQTAIVNSFARESGPRFRPTLGRGEGQIYNSGRYTAPQDKTSAVIAIGDGYHVSYNKAAAVHVVQINADRWKSWVHERLSCPLFDDKSERVVGSLSLFAAPGKEHWSLAKHLTSEHQEEEFIPGRGTVVRWVRDHKNNHWFDGLYGAAAAAHLCGVRLGTAAPPPAPIVKAVQRRPFTTPDGQPFHVLNR